jgi:hypothetical protein
MSQAQVSAAVVTTFVLPLMMTDIERFDDCLPVNIFAIQDVARKHGGRTVNLTIRENLVNLLKKLAGTPVEGEELELIQSDVLQHPEAEKIASDATLRSIMMECAETAGVKVVVQRGRKGPRGALGQRDETIVRERLFREFMGTIVEAYPEGIKREDLESLLMAEGFKIAYIKAMATKIAGELNLTIVDREKTGRKVDEFRMDVTRKALKAADAAGLRTRAAICSTVLRFWQAHGVECAMTESVAYTVVLAVRKADAPQPAQAQETAAVMAE